MTRILGAIVALLAGLAAAGCSGPVGVDPADTLRVERDAAAPAQTDSLTYHGTTSRGDFRTVITVQFRNVTAERISFVHCMGAFDYVLQQRVGEGWVSAWGPDVWACLSSEPMSVEPGATMTLRLPVFSGRRGSNVFPQFPADRWPPGVYRIDIPAARHGLDVSKSEFGRQVPLEARLSNAFVLR